LFNFIFEKSLEEILPSNGNKDLIRLYNFENTYYMNSAIQCLSNGFKKKLFI
jgi:ubiquitin C-terminal hydrolase